MSWNHLHFLFHPWNCDISNGLDFKNKKQCHCNKPFQSLMPLEIQNYFNIFQASRTRGEWEWQLLLLESHKKGIEKKGEPCEVAQHQRPVHGSMRTPRAPCGPLVLVSGCMAVTLVMRYLQSEDTHWLSVNQAVVFFAYKNKIRAFCMLTEKKDGFFPGF